MTLSDDVRNELAAIAPERRCDRLAELSALFHTAGSVHLRGRGAIAVHLDVVSSAVARRAFSLLRDLGVHSEIRTYQQHAFDRATRYQLHVDGDDDALVVLREAGVLERAKAGVQHSGLPQHHERIVVAFDVELVAGGAVERVLLIGADLGVDAEVA